MASVTADFIKLEELSPPSSPNSTEKMASVAFDSVKVENIGNSHQSSPESVERRVSITTHSIKVENVCENSPPTSPDSVRSSDFSYSTIGRESTTSPVSIDGTLHALQIQANKVKSASKKDSAKSKAKHQYVTLISEAILSVPRRKMRLVEIQKYISDKYPQYDLEEANWKNSVRHNLSMYDCFMKTDKHTTGTGKGWYWGIHPSVVEDFAKGDFSRRSTRRRVRSRTAAAETERDISNTVDEHQVHNTSPGITDSRHKSSSANSVSTGCDARSSAQQSVYSSNLWMTSAAPGYGISTAPQPVYTDTPSSGYRHSHKATSSRRGRQVATFPYCMPPKVTVKDEVLDLTDLDSVVSTSPTSMKNSPVSVSPIVPPKSSPEVVPAPSNLPYNAPPTSVYSAPSLYSMTSPAAIMTSPGAMMTPPMTYSNEMMRSAMFMHHYQAMMALMHGGLPMHPVQW